MTPQKNQTSPQGLRIVTLCHQHPGSTVEVLAKLSTFTLDKTHAIVQTQRNNKNIQVIKNPSGRAMRGCYEATAKGRKQIGVAQIAQPAQSTSSHYTRLNPIIMVSHRPGAWDANAIERRGLAC
jgi:hypothetical protein